MGPDATSPADHLDEDRCLDLVLSLLPDGSRRRALEHASSCPSCEAMLRRAAAIHARGRARAKESLSAAATAAIRADPLVVRPSPVARPYARLLLAAAGLAIVTGVAWWSSWRGESAKPEWAPVSPLELSHAAVHRAGAVKDSLVFAGIAAYQRGAFSTACTLLAVGTPSDPTLDPPRRVFLASAQLRTGAASLALATLEGFDESALPEPWSSETRWTRMVALREMGEHARADSLLRVIATHVGPLEARADSLLRGRSRASRSR